MPAPTQADASPAADLYQLSQRLMDTDFRFHLSQVKGPVRDAPERLSGLVERGDNALLKPSSSPTKPPNADVEYIVDSSREQFMNHKKKGLA